VENDVALWRSSGEEVGDVPAGSRIEGRSVPKLIRAEVVVKQQQLDMPQVLPKPVEHVGRILENDNFEAGTSFGQ
jgi:hypothetical protein